MPAFFNINYLRRRAKIHDMAATGLSTVEIGEQIGMRRQDVLRFLKRPKPIIKKPVSTWWSENAACQGEDIDLFYTSATGSLAVERKNKARAICAGCPVRQRCLDTAEANYEQNGIWGGVDFSQFRYEYRETTGEIVRKLKRGAARGAVA